MSIKQSYPCYRCSGLGRIQAFGHVLGGVCFKCGGSGRQIAKPTKVLKWMVLDTNDQPVYNISAKTQQQAVRIALTTFSKSLKSSKQEAIEFVASHDMSAPTAVPFSEYWISERLEKV